MNIKEIIDAERWMDGCEITTEDANEALDRIEFAVTAYVAELEEALDVSYNAEREALKAELEAARQTIICDGIWSFACGECQRPVNRDECYCAKCGAKLEWT